jgi:uncharacterized protein (UPF0333 family)
MKKPILRGQTALEYLMIVGGIIVIVLMVILMLNNTIFSQSTSAMNNSINSINPLRGA